MFMGSLQDIIRLIQCGLICKNMFYIIVNVILMPTKYIIIGYAIPMEFQMEKMH